MDDLKRTERRRVLAAGALLTLLALDVLWGLFASRLLSGVPVPRQRWLASGANQQLLDALAASFLCLFAATGAAWMTWQYAAHESLWQRSVPGLRRKPNVVGWWLVPIVGPFIAGFAMGEIAGSVPIPHWMPRRALHVLLAAWWVAFFLFSMRPATLWDTTGPIAIGLSSAAAVTFALASLLALPLVWLLDRGIGQVLPWVEPVPVRRDAVSA